MSRRESIARERLEAVEAELRGRLREDLPGVAAGRCTLYFAAGERGPWWMRQAPRGREAYDLSQEALALCAELGEPDADSIARRFRDAVDGFRDVSDPHRLGPGRLAADLLARRGPRAC